MNIPIKNFEASKEKLKNMNNFQQENELHDLR